MRFIIQELSYERPIAAGQFRYQRDGRPTGAVESWRLTAAADGYHFLRVDLDAREAESGHSTLYHATLDDKGLVGRLQYRFWGKVSGVAQRIRGNVIIENNSVIAIREANDETQERVIAMPGPEALTLWFPSTIGLSLLNYAPVSEIQPSRTVTITLRPPEDGVGDAFAAWVVETFLQYEDDDVVERHSSAVAALSISWEGHDCIIWSDERRLPVHLECIKRFEAVSTRHVQY